MSLERQEEVRDDAQSAVRAPWQFEWKRPRSSPVKVSASEDKEAEGQCLCMTSAEVSVEELPEYHSNVEKHPFSSLVLTVTIVSSPFCERDNDDVDETGSNNDNKGDLIVLEVTQQPGPLAENDGGESETKDAGDEKEEKEDAHSIQQQQPRMILRKVLRWPGVALKETTTTPEQQQEETWRHHLPVWLGGLPRKRELPETTGVLSACLCRRLLDHDPRTAAALDALDTMTFLSLGMDPELSNHCTSKDKATAPDEEITEEQRQDQMENTATTPSIPELVLACLCSDGSVHVYSPFKLLLKEENGQNHPNRQIDVFANSMSTFLLGDYVFKQLRSSIWPLSQPKATVRLTVPLKKGGGKEGTISSRQKRNTGGNEGEEEEKEDSNSISMWDKSVWDPTVDPFTAIYRTKDNVPTICISAFEYLVIAGRGIQVKARRRRQRQEPTKSRPLLGGFITILSLRHFSEIRTLFLPFAPKQVSPFVWGGMQFLFVLGEQSVAVAIRIDISINNTIVCGEKPSASTWQSRDPNEPLIPTVSSEQSLQSSASNSAMEGRHGRSKNKARAFLHRFQILPILLPQNVADEDALQLAVARLFGSSTFTSPPGLALICPSKRKQEVFVLQRTLEAIDYYKPRDTNLLFQGYRRSRDRRILAISTVQENRHVARITLSRNDEDERPLPSEISTLQKCSNICCHLGQVSYTVFYGSLLALSLYFIHDTYKFFLFDFVLRDGVS